MNERNTTSGATKQTLVKQQNMDMIDLGQNLMKMNSMDIRLGM